MEEELIRELIAEKFDLLVINFEKHHKPMKNPNTQRTWAKLQSDWFLDPKICELTLSEQCIFLRLFALYSSNPGHFCSTSVRVLSRSVHIRPENVRRCLVKLVKLQIIEIKKTSLERERREKRESAVVTTNKQAVRLSPQPETPGFGAEFASLPAPVSSFLKTNKIKPNLFGAWAVT